MPFCPCQAVQLEMGEHLRFDSLAWGRQAGMKACGKWSAVEFIVQQEVNSITPNNCELAVLCSFYETKTVWGG